MVKNLTLLKFRKEHIACEYQGKMQKLHKRVTWSRQSQGPRTAAVNCPGEYCDETEPNFLQNTCRIQPQGQTCRRMYQGQTFSHLNWSEQESPESSEESHKWIFGSSKLKLESLRFSFLENCADQNQR
eukprot:GFUD01056467.1.p1 GENE.GFUD01056467.1~~GFUD01056467.1.p1  ORF type:complete len:137 (+),score=31.53 GFUD01056467.1:30-413(+)